MNKFNELYDTIHMPQALEVKIMNAKPATQRKSRPTTAVAAVLAVVLMLGMSPTVRAAVNEWVITTFPDLGLTIYSREPSEEGQARGDIIHSDTLPTFVHLENGRLVFTGNGENLDITDQLTEEEPFFYTYQQDEYEIILIVGYDGSIENFGDYGFVKKNGQWFTGSGRNYLDMETETAYPWVQTVWDTLDIPWPMPGKEVATDIVITP